MGLCGVVILSRERWWTLVFLVLRVNADCYCDNLATFASFMSKQKQHCVNLRRFAAAAAVDAPAGRPSPSILT